MRSRLLVCLLAASACSTSPVAPATTLTAAGTWKATLAGSFTPGGSGVMSLTLSQTGTTVTGTGTFADPTDPPPAIITVTGSVNGSSVTLTLQVQPQLYQGLTIDANKAPLQFGGTLTSTTMNGSLNGGGPPAVTALTANFSKQ